MLGGEVGDVIEGVRIAEVAGRADFSGGFNLLAVFEGKLLATFEDYRDAGSGPGRQLQRELAAVRGEDRRICDAAGEQDSFRVLGVQPGSPPLPMKNLSRYPGEGQGYTDNRQPHGSGTLESKGENQHQGAERRWQSKVGQVEEVEVGGQNPRSKGSGGKQERLTH